MPRRKNKNKNKSLVLVAVFFLVGLLLASYLTAQAGFLIPPLAWADEYDDLP